MKFNQEKSKIMLHTKIGYVEEGETIKGLQVVRETKVLGYMLDSRSNNMAQIDYLEKKIIKA